MRTKYFSLDARMKSVGFAIEGLWYFFKTEHNAWIHCISSIAVLLLAYVLKISAAEWLLLIFCIGLVMVAEILNTAIEILLDHLSAEWHPQVKIIKDIAAAAVLLAAFIAVISGMVIFIPKILAL